MKAAQSLEPTLRRFDHRLYAAMALLAAAVVLIGFSRTFYLRAWFDTPPLSALRYAHGVAMTAWYALFLTQVALISRRRVDIHRRLGIAAALAAVVVVGVGVATAIYFVTRVRGNPEESAFAAVVAGYDLVSLLIFALLVGTALALRRRSDIHKRLMTLASMSLLGPPLARVVSDQHALWLTYVLVLLPIAIDTWRHRRLHPAFGWGGALILVSSRVALHYVASHGWMAFALRTFP
jgi:hypothetical protein